MKYSEITLTRTQYDASDLNKAGTFVPSDDYISRMGWTLPLTDAQLDSSFAVYKRSAFEDINAANPSTPLTYLQWSDISATQALVSAITNALITQISNLRANGLIEIKQSSQLSTTSGQATIDTNQMVITTDQIDQDTEDELNKVNYFAWNAKVNSDGSLSWYVGNVQYATYLSVNKIAWSSIFVKGKSKTLLTDDEITDLINSLVGGINQIDIYATVAFDDVFDWDAKIASYNTGNSLTDVDGNIIPGGSIPAGKIVIWRPSAANTTNSLAETTFIDTSKVMLKTSANNAEALIVVQLSNAVQQLANTKAEKEDIKTKVINSSNSAGQNTQMAQDYTEVEYNDVVRWGKVQDIATSLLSIIEGVSANFDNIQNQINQLASRMSVVESGVNDWNSQKGGLAKISDLKSSIKNTVNIPLVESGNDVIATLTPASVNGFTVGEKTTFLLLRDNVTPNRTNEIYDYYNDSKVANNTIALEGTSYNVTATSIPTQLTISGLAQAQRTLLTTNYRLIELSQQSAQSGASIDQVARDAAGIADGKAVAAQAAADSAIQKADALKPFSDKMKTIPVLLSDGSSTEVSKNYENVTVGATGDIDPLTDGVETKKNVNRKLNDKLNKTLSNGNVADLVNLIGDASKANQQIVTDANGKLAFEAKPTIINGIEFDLSSSFQVTTANFKKYKNELVLFYKTDNSSADYSFIGLAVIQDQAGVSIFIGMDNSGDPSAFGETDFSVLSIIPLFQPNANGFICKTVVAAETGPGQPMTCLQLKLPLSSIGFYRIKGAPVK